MELKIVVKYDYESGRFQTSYETSDNVELVPGSLRNPTRSHEIGVIGVVRRAVTVGVGPVSVLRVAPPRFSRRRRGPAPQRSPGSTRPDVTSAAAGPIAPGA
nr:uncharacterized protein LOC108013923 [Drosophila suzukii]